MGWVSEEFQTRLRARQASSDTAGEKRFEQLAAQRWRELLDRLQADVTEYSQQGGAAIYDESAPTEAHVACQDTALTLVLRADLANRVVRYWYESQEHRIAAPEGGMFSLRLSRGCVELYSSDQRVTSEGVRRLLLEPIFFPIEPAA